MAPPACKLTIFLCSQLRLELSASHACLEIQACKQIWYPLQVRQEPSGLGPGRKPQLMVKSLISRDGRCASTGHMIGLPKEFGDPGEVLCVGACAGSMYIPTEHPSSPLSAASAARTPCSCACTSRMIVASSGPSTCSWPRASAMEQYNLCRFSCEEQSP